MTDHTDELAGPSAGMPDVVRTLDMAIDEAMYARTSRVSLHLTRAREVRAELLRLADECAEHEQSFDLRWKADMRAIAKWREANPPGKGLTVPDHADLCMWLAERAERAEAELAALKRMIAEAATGVAKRSLAPGCLVIEGFDDDPSDFHNERVALLPVGGE